MHPRKNLHRQPINIGKQLLQTIMRSKNADQNINGTSKQQETHKIHRKAKP